MINGKWGWYDNGDEKKDIKYEGWIQNGKPNGKGTLTTPNGFGEVYSTSVGVWKEGKPWNVKVFDKNGELTKKMVNGEWK